MVMISPTIRSIGNGPSSREATSSNCSPAISSIYIREESFEPFNTLVLGAAPNFDWYGETRLACLQIERLLTDLGTLRDKIGRAGSTDELRVAFGGDFRWYSADIPFRLETRRTQLLAIADAIAGIGRNALSHRTSLWLLGL